jgi:hypothetical protein
MKSLALILAFCAIGACSKVDTVSCIEYNCRLGLDQLPLNQFKFIGSHNSYKLLTNEALLSLALNTTLELPEGIDPLSWEYNHFPLEQQFSNYGIRGIELDIYRDPDGGRFYERKGNALVAEETESGISALLDPGLKVLHFPDFDYNTNYLSFIDALNTVKMWSANHQNHLPITIVIEAKEESPADLLDNPFFTTALKFDSEGVEEIENEIDFVFGDDSNKMIRPDDIRAGYTSLNEAIKDHSWPNLGETRGKIIFVLLASAQVVDHYLQGHESLEDRNMFVFSNAGNPETAYLRLDDPITSQQLIKDRVNEGYIVRTRTDADTHEARNNSYKRKNDAFASGAQLLYTDYYSLLLNNWSEYVVSFKDGNIAEFNTPDEFIAEIDCLSSCTVIE